MLLTEDVFEVLFSARTAALLPRAHKVVGAKERNADRSGAPAMVASSIRNAGRMRLCTSTTLFKSSA
jgi:hypothetical protein